MENINVNEISENLMDSLDNTQKNATDTEKLVQQVQAMSGKEIHEQTVQAILADENTGLEEKISLIHRENADYDQHEENNTGRVLRMQDTQTENVGKATSWWSENWGWVAGGALFAIAVFTPGGRRIVGNATKLLTA